MATAPTPKTFAEQFVCSSPRAEVPATPVGATTLVPVTVTDPTAPVPTTVVTLTYIEGIAAAFPTDPVAETPVTVTGMAWFQASWPQVPRPQPVTLATVDSLRYAYDSVTGICCWKLNSKCSTCRCFVSTKI